MNTRITKREKKWKSEEKTEREKEKEVGDKT